MERITSRQNPLCGQLKKLAASAAFRREQGRFLCDSPKLLGEAALWGASIDTVLFTPGTELPDVDRTGVRLVEVSESVMKAVSPMETPQGVVFTCLMDSTAMPETVEPGRYVLLEGVQDPGNVGTVLRTADAFGWQVILLPGCADLYNPKTLRSAMGVHFRAPVWTAGLEEAAEKLRAANLPLYTTALRADTADVRDVALGQCAVIIGSEGRGVSQAALDICDRTIKIPMAPTCESLNAAVAAAVLLWEGARAE